MKAEYDPAVNYVALHLTWLKKHPSFLPKHAVKTKHDWTWLDVCNDLYGDDTRTWEHRNELARIFLQDDIKWSVEYFSQIKLIETPVIDLGKWFVTIGFNHQTFDPKQVKLFISNLFTLKFFDDGSFGVFEYYRANGEHPHIHICLKTSVKTKSQIVQQIFRSKNASKFILNKNFIDVKPFEKYHDEYLAGNKTEDKMSFVERDKSWRFENNYPDIFNKN